MAADAAVAARSQRDRRGGRRPGTGEMKVIEEVDSCAIHDRTIGSDSRVTALQSP